MEPISAVLKRIHYAWFGLGGLWLLALVASTINVFHKPVVVSFGPPPSQTAQSFFVVAFLAYLIGGFILGKIHNRHTANFTKAGYERRQNGDKAEFHIIPAKRHLPFWLFYLFGSFFIFSVPYMVSGNGAGTFLTLLLGGAFAALGLQPKLWRPFPEHDFSVAPGSLTTDGETVPLQKIQGFLIGTSLRGKSDNPNNNRGGSVMHTTQTVYVAGGNPIAAQGMMAAQQVGMGAVSAVGNGIANVANRYFYEMRARSYRIEAVAGGKNLILAKGLDPGTAQAILSEIDRIVASAPPHPQVPGQ